MHSPNEFNGKPVKACLANDSKKPKVNAYFVRIHWINVWGFKGDGNANKTIISI